MPTGYYLQCNNIEHTCYYIRTILYKNMVVQMDIILITGCNVVGKTTAIYHLTKYIGIEKVHCNTVTDSRYMLGAIRQDDKSDGLHHTHGWCNKSNVGHKHRSEENEPMFPFTVTDNTIPDATFDLFFTALNRLPHISNKIYLVELAGGKNTLPASDPSSTVDYSYTKIKKMYLDNPKYQAWLARVHAVIHITADDEIRQNLKDKRLMHYPKDIAKDTASWLD